MSLIIFSYCIIYMLLKVDIAPKVNSYIIYEIYTTLRWYVSSNFIFILDRYIYLNLDMKKKKNYYVLLI